MRVFVLTLALAVSGCSGEERQAPEPDPSPAAPEPPPPLASQQECDVIEPEPARFEPGTGSAPSEEAALVARPEDARFGLPAGFRVQLYAEGFEGADALGLSHDGDVLVTEREAGRIHRLIDADDDGVAEAREIFGDEENELSHPHGMLFTPGAVFVANAETLMRFALPAGQRRLTGSGGRVGRMAGGEGLERHALTLAANRQNLYLSVPGAGDGEGGTIDEVSFSGARRRVFASGLRDAAATGLHPRDGSLWAAVTSADETPDFLAHIEDGAFYGWPAGSDGDAHTREVLFTPGSRPRSLAFARGGAFPDRYRTGAFVGLAGAAPRVVYTLFDDTGAATGQHEDFLTGFVSAGGAWGRPSALLAHPDGSLLITDGVSRVFRVSWAGL